MAVNNSLSTTPKKVGLTAYLNSDAIKDNINKVLGGKDAQRFITSIISAANANPSLAECDNASIVSSAMLGEALKLSPSPQLGHYYLVPFNDKNRGKVAQFQIGYKGYLQLAIRSGQYKKINVVSIKQGELIRFDPLDEVIEVNLIQDEDLREQTETIGYYAMFEYTNGFRKAMYWSKAKMEAHALKYSKGYQAKKGYTFWEKDFDGMAYKTMLRQLISKWGIMSIEMQTAMDSDMAVINEDGTRDYVDIPDIIDAPVVEPKEETKEEPKADENDVEKALFG